MMFIVGQCVPFNPGSFFNNDFDYKASSINSGDSQNNYPIERLSTEKYKSPTDDDKYLSVEKREISGLNTYSSFKSESPEPESSFLRIRKRDDDEESSPQPESGGNEDEPKAESDENEEEPKPESGGNEEEPKAESGENEEEPKPESGGNEESPAREPNEEKPDDQEEGLIPPPSKESLPPEPVEEEESSTSNLEEPPVLPTSNQEDMPFSKNKDTSKEDFVFQKKPLSFGVLKQKGKVGVSTTANGMDSGPIEFMPEDNWGEDSFYPRSFPSVWKGKKSRTIKPPNGILGRVFSYAGQIQRRAST
ncbi:hypothetical protein AVEN_186432-1 [Araneus ventricosus]|uniref:Uncharacterized protein n=1 Tax=Araneus ventricosus TaxID=182803 RepID=A0A4Y2UKW7_ARAVE|nr:hypothetical protein AVEN_186432-1 [Araneus ventricosus]